MKFIRKLIFFILVVLIFGIIFMHFNKLNMEIDYIYNIKKEGNIDIPENVSYFLMDYEGDISQRSLYKAIYWQVDNNIKKYYKSIKNIDKKGLTNYYKNNEKEILIRLGIDNEEEFSWYINELRKLNGNSLVLERYAFYQKDVKVEEDYIEGILIIKFKNNEIIAFNVKALNKKNNSITPIIFSGNVESKYYNFEFKEIEEPKNTVNSSGQAIEEKIYKIF